MKRHIFDLELQDYLGEVASNFEFAHKHVASINDTFWRDVLGNAVKCKLAWRRAEEGADLEEAWEILNEITWENR